MNLKGGGQKHSAHTFWSVAAKLASPLRREIFLTQAFWSTVAKPTSLLRSMSSPQQRVLHHGEATGIPSLYKYSRWPFFPLLFFWCTLSSPITSCVHFFSDFEPSVTIMASKKTLPAKRHHSSSTFQATQPPSADLRRFISREAEWLYHESLCNRSFILE